jgi:hypothetical protein
MASEPGATGAVGAAGDSSGAGAGRCAGSATNDSAGETAGTVAVGAGLLAPPGPGTAEVESALSVLGAFVASFDADTYSAPDAAALVALFTKGERLCTAGRIAAARRVASTDLHLRTGHRTPAEWLAAQTGDSVGNALGALRLGEDLQSQPGLDQALRSGKLAPHRAEMIARATKENPTTEGQLLAGAESDSLRQFRQRCLTARAQGRTAADEARARRRIHDQRRCRTRIDDEGAFCLEAVLTPEAGASVLAALRAESDRLYRQRTADGYSDGADALRADALVALVTGGRGATGGAATAERPRSSSRTRMLIRCDLDALRTGTVGESGVCEIPGVGPVSVSAARAELGHALLDLVVTNGIDVTTVCTLGRDVPEALRTALLERDPRCVVPGCGMSVGLEIDHWRVDFAKGGPTALDNLCRLCAHHHQLKTYRGFRLVGGPGGWQFLPPEVLKRPRRPRKHPPSKPPTPPGYRGPPRFDLKE